MRRGVGMRALLANRSGVVAVEFAILLPLMLALYTLAFSLSDMIAANRKVTLAARTVTDLGSRYSALTTLGGATNNVDAVIAASAQVMLPYGTGTAVRLSEVCASATSATTVTVVWSRTSQGATGARAAGDTLTVPAGLFTTSACQLMGEVSYAYTPWRVLGGAGAVMYLSDTIYMTPRLSASIGLSNS